MVTTKSEDYYEMEKLLRDVDFTKGSDHKGRLRNKLSGAAFVIPVSNEDNTDELEPGELSLVRAAAKRDDGISISGKRK